MSGNVEKDEEKYLQESGLWLIKESLEKQPEADRCHLHFKILQKAAI